MHTTHITPHGEGITSTTYHMVHEGTPLLSPLAMVHMATPTPWDDMDAMPTRTPMRTHGTHRVHMPYARVARIHRTPRTHH